MQDLLLLQLIASTGLFILIWIVQILHYPTFRYVDPAKFIDFTYFHAKSITFIVGPLMLIEMICAGILVFFQLNLLSGINFLLVIHIWLATAFISVPCHNQLHKSHDARIIEKLIQTNWLRTIPWTIKFIVSLYLWKLGMGNV